MYDILNLLGDIGGIFSSIYFLGQLANYLFVGDQESHQVLAHYFRVNKGRDDHKTDPTVPSLKQASHFKTSIWVKVSQGTILKYLFHCLCPN